MTNQSADLKAFNKSGQLTINCSESISVCFSRAALSGALACDLQAQVLNFLAQPSESLQIPEKVAAVLSSAGLAETAANGYAVTNFINNLLDDGRGNHLSAVVMREFQRNGLTNAQNRIGAWQRFIGHIRREPTENLADRIHEQLDTVKTVGNRLNCLVAINDEIRRLLQISELQARTAAERLEAIDGRLQTNRETSRTPAAEQTVATGRWARMRGAFSGALNYVNERIQSASIRPAANRPAAFNIIESLERESLSTQIKVAALGVERDFLNALIELISQYIQAESETAAFLTAAAQEAANRARTFENTRSYGYAASEILLNDAQLTAAAIRLIWREETAENLTAFVTANYLKDGNDTEILSELARLDLSELPASIERLQRVCSQLIDEKTAQFTITDALSILLLYGQSNLKNKLIEVFKATASVDFLSSRYRGFLPLKIYAAVSLAPSRYQEHNQLVEDLLAEIKKSVRLRFDTKTNRHDPERLLFFCEFFSVPLSAFRFYESYAKDFEKVMDQPRYQPHSDIY